MSRRNRFTLHARNGPHGLRIYLSTDTCNYFLAARRPNGLLWLNLRDGVSLDALRRVKPIDTRSGQKYFHYVKYLLKVADDFIEYDMVRSLQR